MIGAHWLEDLIDVTSTDTIGASRAVAGRAGSTTSQSFVDSTIPMYTVVPPSTRDTSFSIEPKEFRFHFHMDVRYKE